MIQKEKIYYRIGQDARKEKRANYIVKLGRKKRKVKEEWERKIKERCGKLLSDEENV